MGGGNIIESTSVIVTVLLILAACKFGQAVLEPVVFAIFIIEIAWPMQKMLQSKLGKATALASTVVVTTTLALALLSVIVWGGRQVADWVAGNLDRIQESLISSTAWLEEHDIFVFALLSDHFDRATVVRIIHATAMRANTVMAFAVIVLIYVILGLGEVDALTGRIATLKDQDTSRRLIAAGRKIGAKFRTYMLVRTVASIATGLAVWGFALVLHLEMASAWGVLAFALNYLPYIGSLIVTAALSLFAFVQFGSFETPLLVLLGVSFIQAVIGSYLEPVFSGSALSISPPLVLFAIVLWTFLWGALGAFLGVPLMIAALTLLEEFPSTRWIADILSGGRTSVG